MKLYLAGPMRGIENFNFHAFHEAASRLRAQGHEVFSPAERDIERWGSAEAVAADYAVDPLRVARECFAADTEWICRHAEGIALLPGWEGSKGANAEVALADCLGLKVIYL